MEKLILTYWNGGDYSPDAKYITIPFEYESKEKAQNDFFELAYSALKQYLAEEDNYWKGIEFFKGYTGFDIMEFFQPNAGKRKIMNYENIELWEYNAPTILTLEEWFELEKQEIHQIVLDDKK